MTDAVRYRMGASAWPAWGLWASALVVGVAIGVGAGLGYRASRAPVTPPVAVAKAEEHSEPDAAARELAAAAKEEAEKAARELAAARESALATWTGSERGPSPEEFAEEKLRELVELEMGTPLEFRERESFCWGCGQWGPREWGWRFVGYAQRGKRKPWDFDGLVEYSQETDRWRLVRLWIRNTPSQPRQVVVDEPLSPWLEEWVTAEVERKRAPSERDRESGP